MSEPARLSRPETRPRADREAFLREGYTIVRGVLGAGDLAIVNAEMAELFDLQLRARGLPVDPGPSREAWQANAQRLLAVDVEAYINTARMTQMVPSAHRLMTSDAILGVARDLGVEVPVICTRLSNHIMSEALRIPGGYHKSPPHQDWRSMQGSLDSIVIWAPTTSVTGHPLEVAPRSHLLGLLPTVEHIMTPTVADPRISEESFVALEMGPGDVVAFSSFLVHRTGERGDGQVRIAFSTRFNNAAEPTYAGHGYPTPYKYAYRTDLMFEDFPTADDLRRVFPDAEGWRRAMATIAIMQPYFLPYAGYFRLIARSDLFVIYDCVQFPRRGWLHRNKLLDARGEEQWLTLPLSPAPQDVKICDLAFPADAAESLAERLRPFPVAARGGPHAPLLARLRHIEGRPVDYIEGLLAEASGLMGLAWNVVRSSSLGVAESFRGQERILEICRRLEASRYLNAPGGRELYDPETFSGAGVELAFLEPWAGAGGSILQRLADDATSALADQVRHG